MLKSFDLVLLYYDKPEILRNWFHRLVHFSDFQKFAARLNANIIIADSGSPRDRIESNLQIVREQPEEIRKRVIYARADTDELRKNVPEGVAARPQCHAYNMAITDISRADLIIGSVIGHIFSPKYFNGHLAIHLQRENCLVLPKRFDLNCPDYHTNWFNKPWNELKQFQFMPSGGWPDFSVYRKHYTAIGGWDEYYSFIGPVDMEFGSRLTGKLDNGAPSEALFQGKPPFKNYGLEFVQPYREDEILSLTCNTYGGHRPKNDPEREKGHQIGTKYYLDNWGVINRNQNRVPSKYETYLF